MFSALLIFSTFVLTTAQPFHPHHSYDASCPPAELIIRDTVLKHSIKNPSIPAALLRLHFHDCFVNGCDASVLLESTPSDGRNVERFAVPNNNSLRGFEIIEEAKRRVELICPGIVSCADILALAARDSTVMLGGFFYDVPTGRFDGRVSNRTLANLNLPSPFFNIQQLKDNFKAQGLSVQDLVILSGGHTIGKAKCKFFESRLYNFSNTGKPDPTLNPAYRSKLLKICTPEGADPSPSVALDKNSESSFDNVYYKNLVRNNGLLVSDQALIGSSDTSGLVKSLAQSPIQFKQLFALSMINMGNIAWKTSYNGEVRKKCFSVNRRIPSEAGHAYAF